MNFVEAIESWMENDGWQFADREAAWKWFFEQGQKAAASGELLAALQDKDNLLHRCEELRALLFFNTKILPGDKLFEFSSKQQWINKAQQIWKFHEVRAADTICVDQLGRLCNIGKHFMDAERDNAYPIEVFRMREDMTPNDQHNRTPRSGGPG